MKDLEIVREKIQNHYRVIRNDEDLEWNRAIDLCTNIINAHLSRGNSPEFTRLSRDNDGWIPVEDRLPEDDGFYIATMDGGIVGQEEPFVGLAELENGLWVDDDIDYRCIIAWQSLPEPYRLERSSNEK